MQIHEVTRPITEGILDTVKAIAQNPKSLISGQHLGTALDQAQRAEVQRNQGQLEKTTQLATQEWSKRLSGEWAQHAKSLAPKTPPQSNIIKPGATAPGRPAPGQMPASVANSAQGQKMQQAYGTPRGGIQGMQSDLEEAPQEYTTTGGIVVPGGTKTDKSTVTPSGVDPDQYKQQFLDWADKKIQSRIPGTRFIITGDQVRARADAKLDAALKNVLSTRDNVQANQTAVQQYLIQVAQVVREISDEQKSKMPPTPTVATGTNPFSDIVGDQQIQQIKSRLTNNPELVNIAKKILGIR